MSRLENSGKDFREELLSRNLYTPNDIYDIDNPKVIQAIDSISRLLRPGNAFNFSNTVIGRVIGPQTPITEIGRRALFNLYTEQIKSTIIRKKAPLINFNNILRNDRNFISENIDFSITKEDRNNIESKLFDILTYSGVNRLSNPIRIESTINEEKNYNTNELSKFYLTNTGRGQRQALINNLNNNIFSNNLNDMFEIDNTSYKTILISKKSSTSFLNKFFDVENDITSIGFAVSRTFYERHFRIRYNNRFYLRTNENGIPNLNKQTIEEDFGSNYFISKRFKDIDPLNDNDIVTLNDKNRIFTWGVNQPETIRNSKGILGYTAALFNILNNRNNAPFNKTVNSIELNGENYYNGIRYGINDNNENPIPGGERSYSLNNQMDRISKTIKPFGYDQQIREKSPLFKRPIPKIVLDSAQNRNDGVKNDVMFTIENLAIDASNFDDLSEIGPNGGRILWFSPMIESFNESISPNINTTNFLGRGEPVYTYANTERKLTINFLMIVDHVEELVGVTNFNQFQDRLYNLRRKQKQDKPIVNKEENKSIKQIEELNETIKELRKIKIPFDSDAISEIFHYFENNVRIIDPQYEINGLNADFENQINRLIFLLGDYYNQNPNARFDISFEGYASLFQLNISDEVRRAYNRQLSVDRANALKDFFIERIRSSQFSNLLNIINFKTVSFGDVFADGRGEYFETNKESIGSDTAKRDRKASINNVSLVPGTDEIDIELEIPNIERDILLNLENERDNIIDSNEEGVELQEIEVSKTLRDDYDEFSGDDKNDTFSKIKDYRYQNGLIVYTPYELYKRLTFLNQCTRQGSTQEFDSDGNIITSNSVFGRPPFIIFRLGDMYNTKAIITSLTFDFENNIPWDINPEGFGVQKMGCRVVINMNLIGGSSVDYSKEKPISHILNAESRRFYANSRFEAGVDDILDREEILLKNIENNREE
jgi:hypothetical protein